MKKYHLLVAAILVLPVFFSCGGKNNPEKPDNPSTPTTPTTPTNPTTPTDPTDPPQPPEPQIEFRRTFRFDGNVFSTNRDGDFVAVLRPDFVTKAADNHKIVIGGYSFDNSGKTWSYSSLGKIELLDDKKIAFTPNGGTRTVYDVEVSEIVSDESSNANKMNGSWTIKETILEFRGVNYTLNGLDLNEVEKLARDQGIEFKFHMDDNMVVKKVLVTDSLLAAEFNNGQAYAAEHNLRLGSDFNLSEYTNGLEGSAKVQFVDELCVITIETTLDESPAKIRMTLQKLS